MQIQHCTVEGGAQQSAPNFRLVQGLSRDREQARLQARAALRSCLAQELACPEQALRISNQRNQAPQLWLHGVKLEQPFCSISHGEGLALLAWHHAGSVGVDIQAVSSDAPRQELQAVAQLFLTPNMAKTLELIGSDALFFKAFSRAWVAREACLKCAGIGLVERSDALENSLTGMHCQSFILPDGYAAAAAWSWRGPRRS